MAKLYIVGTPIGNMQDITLRAIDTLKSVDIIACEDTRHSLPLLNKYDIKAKLIAYHKFNEQECAKKIVEIVSSGQSVAIITDAGMPSISDPGAELVSLCRDMGVDVEVVPGPTAFASAVSLSGIKASGFTFIGFLPEKNVDKVSILSKCALTGLPIVLYVAPHDLTKTASQIYEVLGDRKVYVVRELTKMHECVEVSTLSSFQAEERGEIVMIVEGVKATNPLNNLTIKQHLDHYIEMGIDKKEAIKMVAKDRAIPKNEVYQQSINQQD